MIELPEEWTTESLDTLSSDITYGYTAKSNSETGDAKMLRITDIQENRVDWDTVPYCEITTQDMEKYRLKKWDLVFARTGATVGKSFLIRDDLSNAVYASYLIRVRCIDEHLAVFLSHFFNSPVYWDQITEFSAGIGQPNVNGSKLKELTLPLAPLAEQKVIADKLDALLAQVDTLKARLDAIPAILKRFRQSVLSAAVTGKLTLKWSSQQVGPKEHLDYPSAPPPEFPATIPSDWKWVAVGDLASKVADGVHQKPSYVPIGIPFVTVKNLTAGKGIDFSQTNFISEADHAEFCKRTLPERDDILITKDGTLGVVRRIETDFAFSIFVSLALVKPRDRRLSKYLEIAFSSLQVQAQMVGVGTGLQHIHLRDLRQDVIPLPSIEEQTEIVRRVESLFAFADQIEARVQEATARVKHLTQSILAKAFRGELTEEWRKAHPELVSGENSAAALLERIRATRAATPEAKGKRGRQAQHSPSEARVDGEDFSPSPNAPKKRGRPRKG